MLVINRVFIHFQVLHVCVKSLCCSVAGLCLTLQCHGLQHARLLCLPLYRRLCSNSCPLNGWCHVNFSSSVAVFSFCFQSFLGFPSGSAVENLPAMWETCRSHSFNPWVRKIPWRRKWQPTPIFLPEKYLAGYSPWGSKESNRT